MMRLSSMTMVSFVGHIMAMMLLLALSMITPIRLKKPERKKPVMVHRVTPPPATPEIKPVTPKPTPQKTKVVHKTP